VSAEPGPTKLDNWSERENSPNYGKGIWGVVQRKRAFTQRRESGPVHMRVVQKVDSISLLGLSSQAWVASIFPTIMGWVLIVCVLGPSFSDHLLRMLLRLEFLGSGRLKWTWLK